MTITIRKLHGVHRLLPPEHQNDHESGLSVRWIAIVVAVVLFAASCGDDEAESESTTTTTRAASEVETAPDDTAESDDIAPDDVAPDDAAESDDVAPDDEPTPDDLAPDDESTPPEGPWPEGFAADLGLGVAVGSGGQPWVLAKEQGRWLIARGGAGGWERVAFEGDGSAPELGESPLLVALDSDGSLWITDSAELFTGLPSKLWQFDGETWIDHTEALIGPERGLVLVEQLTDGAIVRNTDGSIIENTDGKIWSSGYIRDGSAWVPADRELSQGVPIRGIRLAEDESVKHELVFADSGDITVVPIETPFDWDWVQVPVFGDDSAWVLMRGTEEAAWLRYADSGWTTYPMSLTAAEQVCGLGFGPTVAGEVGPDGSLWYASPCDTVIRIDPNDESTTEYALGDGIAVSAATDLDIGDDGTVLVAGLGGAIRLTATVDTE